MQQSAAAAPELSTTLGYPRGRWPQLICHSLGNPHRGPVRFRIAIATPLVLLPGVAHAQIPTRPPPPEYAAEVPLDVARWPAPPLSTVPVPTEALHRIQPQGASCVAWTSDTLTPLGARIYHQDSVTTPPRLVSVGVREYPLRKEQAGKGGRVILRFVIDTLGAPEPCSFSTLVLTDPDFEGPAYRMVLGSKFRPAASDGHRVFVLVQQAVTFNP